MSAPLAELGQPVDSPISPRRGAVVAAALAGTALLVVGYGSGVGLVPATLGDLAAGSPQKPPVSAPPATVPLVPPTVGLDDTGRTTRTPSLVGPTTSRLGPTTVSPWLPGDSGGARGPGIAPPSSGLSPSIPPPPTTRPPTTPRPPAACRGLVDGLLGGLTTYLGGTALDLTLVRQVTAVLGLDRYLASGEPLTEQLLTPLTPVLDVVPSTLDSLGLGLGLGLGSGAAAAADTRLVDDLRGLLGVGDVLQGVTTVTDATLRGLLDGVVGGC